MTANLTQQYRKAEQAYRQATTLQEELKCLQTMLVELPKHKGTDKMQADLKQKISRVRKQLAAGDNKGAGRSDSARIPRQGAGRAVIIGGPNSGKSQLLAGLTRASPLIADYPFSTSQPMPGMMPWEDVFVQLVDTPPISRVLLDATTLSLIRGADLVLLLLDLGSDDGGEQLVEVVDKVNQTKTRLGRATQLDGQNPGVSWTETLLLVNKIDLPEAADRLQFFDEFLELDFDRMLISAKVKTGLPELSDRVFAAMNSIRVYTRLPNRKESDRESPFTLKAGQTLLDLAELIHRDLAGNLKGARVWGSQVHDGTRVKNDYILNDLDIVELHSGTPD